MPKMKDINMKDIKTDVKQLPNTGQIKERVRKKHYIMLGIKIMMSMLESGGIDHPESLRNNQYRSNRISQCSGSTPFL